MMKSHTLKDAHHDSTAEKHEDHHDEGHDEKHVEADEHEHEDHSTEKHQDGHKEDHHDDHEGEEGDHDDDNHTLGASVGIAGGMLLLFGHILNIGTSRKRKQSVQTSTVIDRSLQSAETYQTAYISARSIGLDQFICLDKK